MGESCLPEMDLARFCDFCEFVIFLFYSKDGELGTGRRAGGLKWDGTNLGSIPNGYDHPKIIPKISQNPNDDKVLILVW